MFLGRNKKKSYPRIITKYSSLTSCLEPENPVFVVLNKQSYNIFCAFDLTLNLDILQQILSIFYLFIYLFILFYLFFFFFLRRKGLPFIRIISVEMMHMKGQYYFLL